jgi:hypothetical protein
MATPCPSRTRLLPSVVEQQERTPPGKQRRHIAPTRWRIARQSSAGAANPKPSGRVAGPTDNSSAGAQEPPTAVCLSVSV